MSRAVSADLASRTPPLAQAAAAALASSSDRHPAKAKAESGDREPGAGAARSAGVGVVFNPHSKKNRARPERFDALQRLVGDRGAVRRTRDVDEVASVAAEFLRDGIDIWVADGGDGAFHWLLNAAVAASAATDRPMPLLMPTRSGTIDFLAKKVGLQGSAEDLLAALLSDLRRGQAPATIRLDSLRLRGALRAGGGFDRRGFACAAAGVGQRFFERFYANGDPSARGVVTVVSRILASASLTAPGLSALPASLVPRGWLGDSEDPRALGAAVFAPQPLRVEVDGEVLPFAEYRAINVGAIDIDLAGVFRFFPFAAEEGVLHGLIGNPGVSEVIRLMPAMARGKPLVSPNIVDRRLQTLRMTAPAETTIDPVIDGELFFGLSALEISLGAQVAIALPGGAAG